MVADTFYADFGRLLQKARRRGTQKMTQVDIANAVGLSRSSIANIEMGRQPVQLHLVVRLAKVLGVDVGELIPRQLTAPTSENGRRVLEALQQQGGSSLVVERVLANLPTKSG